jgi:class 3 adenylate cyclase
VPETPTTRYATVGRDHIAYQVIGEGPPDLVFVPHWNTNVEALWDFPPYARFVRHLASFGRVVLFDKRGTGLSDALSTRGEPLLEQFADDLPAVLDAAGVERVALIAGDAAVLMAIVFAASYPERVNSLVLVNAFAGLARPGDAASGLPVEEYDEHERDYLRIWLDGDLSRVAPSLTRDKPAAEQAVRFLRLSASPNAAYDTRSQLLRLDVRDVLPTVQAPTLIIHRTENEYFAATHSRYFARHIEGARLVELPGDDHLMYVGDTDEILGEIEVFVTGERRHDVTERVLTTVLFVDIVKSTSRLAAIGDRRWRELLDRYDAEVARNLELFRGRQVKNIGDGTLAVFDGPARAIRFARALRDALQLDDLSLRSGLHTGEVEMRGDDVNGIAVVTAQRIQAVAAPNEILVSRTVVDLVDGSGIEFTDRGEHDLKGLPGRRQLFAAPG